MIIGSGRDIVEECGVARFLFVDFPLGNPCGKPYDVEMQTQIADLAMDVLEKAFAPRTTIQAPVVWDEDDDAGWRARFMHVGETTAPSWRPKVRNVGACRKRSARPTPPRRRRQVDG